MVQSYKLGVLIPYRGIERDLLPSLESIEFDGPVLVIVVDDSSNPPLNKNNLYASLSNNISLKLISFSSWRGIVPALNTGLDVAESYNIEYLARLDGGDLCVNDRLNKQVKFLEEHPEVVLVGGWAEVRRYDKTYFLKFPCEDRDIRSYLLQDTPFVHPTVVYRLSVIKKHKLRYIDHFPYAEDYEFYSRLLNIGQGRNLPHVVLIVTSNRDNISNSKRNQQMISALRIKLKLFQINRRESWIGVTRSCIGIMRTYIPLFTPTLLLKIYRAYRNRNYHKTL